MLLTEAYPVIIACLFVLIKRYFFMEHHRIMET